MLGSETRVDASARMGVARVIKYRGGERVARWSRRGRVVIAKTGEGLILRKRMVDVNRSMSGETLLVRSGLWMSSGMVDVSER